MTTPYTSNFFQKLADGARRSAEVVVPLLLQWLSPKSVVDVGCGEGTWLAVFREHGVSEIAGVDGDYVDQTRLRIPAEFFLPLDLSEPLRLARRFDLAVSLEVAEHLPADSAEGFVESLVGLAPVVLFSAAIPHQGGTGHINEQWPTYWAERFGRHEYLAVDCLRRKLWNRDDVEHWYAQNVLLYVERRCLEGHKFLLEEQRSCPQVLSLVHPKQYLQSIEWGIDQWKRADELAAKLPDGLPS